MPVLEHSVSRQADRVPEAFGFEELVNPGQCKRSISSEVAPKQPVSITSDNRLEHIAPFVGAVHVAGAKRAALQIAELVEHEQRMIAGAAEMAVVGRAFLLAMGRANGAVHVEHDDLQPVPCMH